MQQRDPSASDADDACVGAMNRAATFHADDLPDLHREQDASGKIVEDNAGQSWIGPVRRA
jgi:hypothetical protein